MAQRWGTGSVAQSSPKWRQGALVTHPRRELLRNRTAVASCAAPEDTQLWADCSRQSQHRRSLRRLGHAQPWIAWAARGCGESGRTGLALVRAGSTKREADTKQDSPLGAQFKESNGESPGNSHQGASISSRGGVSGELASHPPPLLFWLWGETIPCHPVSWN